MWIMLCIATLEVSTRFLDEDKALKYKYIDYPRLLVYNMFPIIKTNDLLYDIPILANAAFLPNLNIPFTH